MDIKKIKHIISQGEGISIEFKKANKELPGNLFETVCAFLNRKGGEILLGVDDNKNILGIDENKIEIFCKQIANLSNNSQKLFPSFLLEPQIIEYKNKKLIYIFVPISSQVHKCNGNIFDRSSDGDYKLQTDAQIKQAYNRKSTEYSENKIYPFLQESDFAEGVVGRVRKMIRINRPKHPWNELTNQEFYKIARLYRNDFSTGQKGFTLSAILLFGKPEVINSIIPHYKIDALLKTENIDRYDDRDNIRCNLIESYDRLMNFVEKHLSDKFYLEGIQRISLRDKIFREVIANMLIHREYINAYPSTFIINKDKVIAKNANKAYHFGQLTLDNYEPFPKNPDIARIFTQIGHCEELGTGIRNIYKYTKSYSNNDNVIFKEDDIFVAEIPLKELAENNDTNNDTNNRLEQIIKLIKKDNKISINKISKKINVSRSTIIRDIEKLKKENILIRKGELKTGYWEIKNN